MVVQRGDLACCVRCAGPTAAGRLGRRHLLKAAVHPLATGSSRPRQARPPPPAAVTAGAAETDGGAPRAASRAGHPGVLTGTVLDTSPQIITLYGPDGRAADRAAPRGRRVERPLGRSHRPGERGQPRGPDAPGPAQRRRPDLGQRRPGDRRDHGTRPGEHAHRRGPDHPAAGRADPAARHSGSRSASPGWSPGTWWTSSGCAAAGTWRRSSPPPRSRPTGPVRRPPSRRCAASPGTASRGRPSGTSPPARPTRTACGTRRSTRRAPAASSRWPGRPARRCRTCRSAAC